jgi:hypothetical protein
MKDFIEQMKDDAEARMQEMTQSDGRLKCGCGRLFNPQLEGTVLSPNPYAMPYCNQCADEHFAALKEIDDED